MLLKENKHIHTLLLIPPKNFPIPAVKGGAVEQLITYLLEENERFGRVRFVVVSKYDSDAVRIMYDKSKVYYFKPNTFECNDAKGFSLAWYIYKIGCKLFKNALCRKIFKNPEEPLGKYHYLCKYIAKLEKVDAISIEGQWELPFAFLNKIVGKENIYTHLHAVRAKDPIIQQEIPNSISISNYVRDSWSGESNTRIKNYVVLNCADTERFAFQPNDSLLTSSKRLKLGINTEDFVVLYCGRIIPEKGILQLLDALEHLDNFPIKLLLIGSASFGAKNTSDFEKEISQRIHQNSSIIPIGFVLNKELPMYYSISDIQIVPTVCQEGAGIVAIEGMAAGLPLIVTESGGMVEYVTDETAIKIPIDDDLPKNIADAVITLYNDPERRKAMGKAGRERAKLFSKENYYMNFVKIFTE